MRKVTTKEELAAAIKNGETVKVSGELASKFKKKKKSKKTAKIVGIATAVAGVALAPLTAGTTLPAAVAGLTIGTVTISTAELAIICGASLAAYGIHKNCKVTFNSDGTVTVEPHS